MPTLEMKKSRAMRKLPKNTVFSTFVMKRRVSEGQNDSLRFAYTTLRCFVNHCVKILILTVKLFSLVRHFLRQW